MPRVPSPWPLVEETEEGAEGGERKSPRCWLAALLLLLLLVWVVRCLGLALPLWRHVEHHTCRAVRRPAKLLPGCRAACLAAWLRSHPSILPIVNPEIGAVSLSPNKKTAASSGFQLDCLLPLCLPACRCYGAQLSIDSAILRPLDPLSN